MCLYILTFTVNKEALYSCVLSASLESPAPFCKFACITIPLSLNFPTGSLMCGWVARHRTPNRSVDWLNDWYHIEEETSKCYWASKKKVSKWTDYGLAWKSEAEWTNYLYLLYENHTTFNLLMYQICENPAPKSFSELNDLVLVSKLLDFWIWLWN